MKFGLQIYSFTWPGGPEAIGSTLARAVRTADDVGFDSIWVMDHFGRSGHRAPSSSRCSRAGRRSGSWPLTRSAGPLGLMVGGVHYRNPGLWVKAATTLDVISGAERGSASAPPEPGGVGGESSLAEPARPVRDARRTPSRSPTGCGRASADRRRPSTAAVSREQALNVPQSISARGSRS